MFAASIPTYCTGPALILTGALMMINVIKIDWNDINKAVPAFLTISIMPLTYSISYGARPLTLDFLHSIDCPLVIVFHNPIWHIPHALVEFASCFSNI